MSSKKYQMGSIIYVDGALIFPATAADTGGVCMACKQGVRDSMTASRAHYQRMRLCDPVRALWQSRVVRSEADRDLRYWQDNERVYFAACLLEGEVCNGGFDPYFHDSASDHYLLAVRGLEAVGALQSLPIVRAAADAMFGAHGPPSDQDARWKIIHSRSPDLIDIVLQRRRATRLEQLDREFRQDPDHLSDRLTAFAKATGMVAPFEGEAT